METESTTNQAEMRIDHPKVSETGENNQRQVQADSNTMTPPSTMTPPTNLTPGSTGLMVPAISMAPDSTSQVTGLEEQKMDLIRLKIKTYDPFIRR